MKPLLTSCLFFWGAYWSGLWLDEDNRPGAMYAICACILGLVALAIAGTP